MKVTARDIFTAAKDLQRYENYACRHMNNKSNIEQVSEKVETAKKVMREAMSEFMETDVSTFTADTTQIENELEYVKQRLIWCKENIQDLKKELENHCESDFYEGDYIKECIGDLKADKKSLKKRIKFLEAELAA